VEGNQFMVHASRMKNEVIIIGNRQIDGAFGVEDFLKQGILLLKSRKVRCVATSTLSS
jgi:hypothetical protein